MNLGVHHQGGHCLNSTPASGCVVATFTWAVTHKNVYTICEHQPQALLSRPLIHSTISSWLGTWLIPKAWFTILCRVATGSPRCNARIVIFPRWDALQCASKPFYMHFVCNTTQAKILWTRFKDQQDSQLTQRGSFYPTVDHKTSKVLLCSWLFYVL